MNAPPKIWRTIDLIRESEIALKKRNISNARLNAELLLSDSLKISRIELYLNFEKPLNQNEISLYKERLKRRLNNEPLQYILGVTEFYGIKFNVRPGVLIPRQETELLVERALEIIKNSKGKIFKILEIGTGSGCISISIAKNYDCTINANDISFEAISIAKENSNLLGTSRKINFIINKQHDDINLLGYDLIVSNPPYISLNDFGDLPDEIKNFEPRTALTDEYDGLNFYRKIFSFIEEKNVTSHILLEIGDGKSTEIKKLLGIHNISNFNIHKDLMGIERVLEINPFNLF